MPAPVAPAAPKAQKVHRLKIPGPPPPPPLPTKLVVGVPGHLGLKQEDLKANSAELFAPGGSVRSFRLWNSKSARYAEDWFFAVFAQSLGLATTDSMRRVSTEKADDGVETVLFRQHHGEVPVGSGYFSLTLVNGKVVSGRGQIARNLGVGTTPAVAEDAALQSAMTALAKPWAWVADPAVPVPKGHLVIYSADFGKTAPFALAWRFSMPLASYGGFTVWVDATTGAVLKSVDQISNVDTPATGLTLANKLVHFTSDAFTPVDPKYRLAESLTRNIHTVDQGTSTSNAPAEFRDWDNVWNEAAVRRGVTAHAAAEAYWDLLKTRWNRNGLDGNGALGLGFVLHVASSGDCNGEGPFTDRGRRDIYLCALSGETVQQVNAEIIGHELTHLLISEIPGHNDDDVFEARGLEEAICDIFGISLAGVFEQRLDWRVLDDSTQPRDFIHPKHFQQPDTYLGTYYAADDVHGIASVGDHWFYLLSQGGQGTNDVGTAYSVDGVGEDAALDLVYRTLTSRSFPSMTFMDFRNASLDTARNQFSPTVLQAATAAWEAVNVTGLTEAIHHYPQTSATGVWPWPLKPTFDSPLVPGTTDVQYELNFATDPDFTQGVVHEQIDAGDPVELMLDPYTVYFWRVKARHSDGKWDEDWAFTSSFETSAVQPRNVRPKHTAQNVFPWPVKMSWSPVDGADRYEVEIADDAGFTDHIRTDSTTSTSFDGLFARPKLRQYWRVRAWKDKPGQWSTKFHSAERANIKPEELERPWTSDDALRFDASDAPPTLLAPSANSTVYPWGIEFKWKDLHAKTYDVEVRPTGGATTVTLNVPNDTHTSGQDLEKSTSYQWHAQGHVAGDAGGWSAWSDFKTNDAAPKGLEPSSSSCIWPARFRWTTVPGATDWELQVSAVDDAGFTKTPSHVKPLGGIGDPNVTLDSTTRRYYWKVRVANAAGVPGAWSNASFAGQACEVTPGLSPNGGTVDPKHATLAWGPAHGAITYHIQLFDLPRLIQEWDVDAVSGNRLDLPLLIPNHAYGWDIIPIDPEHHRGPMASARFQTTPEAEPCHGWFNQGGPEGGTFWVDIGHPGTFTVNWDFVNIPDIASIFDENDNLLFTTGCVNHGPTGILPSVTSPTRFIKVIITPDCDNNPNETKWGIQIECAR